MPSPFPASFRGFVAAGCLASLAMAQVPNDECAAPIVVNNGANGPYSNVGATTSLPVWSCGLGGNDVWFLYSATCTGTATFDTCGGGYDTTIQVFDATCAVCGNFSTGACNDDSCALQSSITLPVTQGGLYYIRVGGFNGATGSFPLNIACTGGGPGTPGDECATASALVLGANNGLSNVGFTTSAPGWPCGLGGNDRWFTFTPATTGLYQFDTCSPGTSYDTTIEAFSGGCSCNQTSLACNDDTCGLQSSIAVCLAANTTYHVRVGGYSGLTGSFDLNVTALAGGCITQTGIRPCGPTTITVTGNPALGGSVTTQLGGVVGLPFIGLGFTNPATSFCSICTLGSDWATVIFGSTFVLNVPNNPTFLGVSVFSQGVDLNGAGGCPNPMVTFTGSYQITIG